MRRREFISLIGAAATWPVAARARQEALPVVDFLNNASPYPYTERVRAFREGLKEASLKNVTIEFRWAEGPNDRLPLLMRELVRRPVNVIFAAPTASAFARPEPCRGS